MTGQCRIGGNGAATRGRRRPRTTENPDWDDVDPIITIAERLIAERTPVHDPESLCDKCHSKFHEKELRIGMFEVNQKGITCTSTDVRWHHMRCLSTVNTRSWRQRVMSATGVEDIQGFAELRDGDQVILQDLFACLRKGHETVPMTGAISDGMSPRSETGSASDANSELVTEASKVMQQHADFMQDCEVDREIEAKANVFSEDAYLPFLCSFVPSPLRKSTVIAKVLETGGKIISPKPAVVCSPDSAGSTVSYGSQIVGSPTSTQGSTGSQESEVQDSPFKKARICSDSMVASKEVDLVGLTVDLGGKIEGGNRALDDTQKLALAGNTMDSGEPKEQEPSTDEAQDKDGKVLAQAVLAQVRGLIGSSEAFEKFSDSQAIFQALKNAKGKTGAAKNASKQIVHREVLRKEDPDAVVLSRAKANEAAQKVQGQMVTVSRVKHSLGGDSKHALKALTKPLRKSGKGKTGKAQHALLDVSKRALQVKKVKAMQKAQGKTVKPKNGKPKSSGAFQQEGEPKNAQLGAAKRCLEHEDLNMSSTPHFKGKLLVNGLEKRMNAESKLVEKGSLAEADRTVTEEDVKEMKDACDEWDKEIRKKEKKGLASSSADPETKERLMKISIKYDDRLYGDKEQLQHKVKDAVAAPVNQVGAVYAQAKKEGLHLKLQALMDRPEIVLKGVNIKRVFTVLKKADGSVPSAKQAILNASRGGCDQKEQQKEDAESVFSKAEKEGLRKKLETLMVRPEIVLKGVSVRKVFTALKNADGSVPAAKRAILGR